MARNESGLLFPDLDAPPVEETQSGKTIEVWFDGVCEPVNPGGHAAWGAHVKRGGFVIMSEGGYCGGGPEMSNNVAEYAAVGAAFEKLISLGGEITGARIVVRGDSKLVINQLKGKWKARGGLYFPFYQKVNTSLNHLRSLTSNIVFEWVPREENSICDELSKNVLRLRGIRFKIQPN